MDVAWFRHTVVTSKRETNLRTRGLLMITELGDVIDPIPDVLVLAAEHSSAARFVVNPQEFFKSRRPR